MAMWIATWESRNFSFVAMGATKAKARDALLDGLEAHGRQYGLESDWFARQYDDWQEEIARSLACARVVCSRDIPAGGQHEHNSDG